ncbi:uncharacterized protein LOC135343038 [Halichondria panicea]|uniref:uncharacterized protein LOC135343038 n=1 Tax=Halichondria panicea TaxID=6063 RepID=UPI00312B6382
MTHNLSNANNNCSIDQFDESQFKIVAGVRAFTGLLSLICAVCVIFIHIAHKKYKFFHQKLILYLAITVILRSIAHLLCRLDYLDGRDLIDEVHCIYIGGFLDLYTSWTQLIALVCIVANIFSNVFLGLDISKVKLLPLLFILLLPLLWCWIPYTLEAFGIEGPWCGIRIHTEECKFFLLGNWLRFGLWEIPIFVLFLLGFLITIVAVAVKMQKAQKEWVGHRYDAKKQEAKQKVLKSIYPLICYPFIFLLLNVPHLVGNLHQSFESKTNVLPIWVLDAIFTPLAGGVIVLAYTFDTRTRQNLKKGNLRQICLACFKNCLSKYSCKVKEKTVNDYHCEAENRFGDSLSGEFLRNTIYVRHQIQNRQIESTTMKSNHLTFDII